MSEEVSTGGTEPTCRKIGCGLVEGHLVHNKPEIGPYPALSYHEFVAGVERTPPTQEFRAELERRWMAQDKTLAFVNWLVEQLWLAGSVPDASQVAAPLTRPDNTIETVYITPAEASERLFTMRQTIWNLQEKIIAFEAGRMSGSAAPQVEDRAEFLQAFSFSADTPFRNNTFLDERINDWWTVWKTARYRLIREAGRMSSSTEEGPN